MGAEIAGLGRDCVCAQVVCWPLQAGGAVPPECDFGLCCPFRIKEEWNFVAECRRKGIPQAAYCKNGFVDTSARLLEKIERNTYARQSSLSKERDKRRSPFVLELSGEQWTVSAARGCPMRCWILLEALTGLGLGQESVPMDGEEPVACSKPGSQVSSSVQDPEVLGRAAGSLRGRQALGSWRPSAGWHSL